jgi:hypothetical protein
VRRAFVLLALALLSPVGAAAQSSQFGVRGLGMPGRAINTRTAALGGAFGLFDGESGLNPAALGGVTALTADFTSLQDFRHIENPAGDASVQETRFPFFAIAGPVRRYPAVLGISFANYTSKDFTLASADTVPLRNVLVPTSDTLAARGGLSDLRFATGVRIRNAWMVGAAFHIITGTSRARFNRAFADTTFQTATQQTELSYAGVGVEVGVIRNFGSGFSVAATARSDGHASVERDSTPAGTIDLPYSFGFGVQWRVRSNLDVASQVLFKTWSAANSDLIAAGGVGSDDTYEASFGAEFRPSLRHPTRLPLRLGVRYGTLPFPLEPGEQPSEFGISAGTGFRFGQNRAGLDFGLEHVWRAAGAFSERTFLLNLGVTVRP